MLYNLLKEEKTISLDPQFSRVKRILEKLEKSKKK